MKIAIGKERLVESTKEYRVEFKLVGVKKTGEALVWVKRANRKKQIQVCIVNPPKPMTLDEVDEIGMALKHYMSIGD